MKVVSIYVTILEAINLDVTTRHASQWLIFKSKERKN